MIFFMIHNVYRMYMYIILPILKCFYKIISIYIYVWIVYIYIIYYVIYIYINCLSHI